MKTSILKKLQITEERFEEISGLLSLPKVIADQTQFKNLTKEYAQLETLVQTYRAYKTLLDEIDSTEGLLDDSDNEVRELAQAELDMHKDNLESLEYKLQALLVPRDPNDDKNVFLEIRAGTGGNEAAIFAGDLFRMYSRYAERMGWRVEILSESLGEHGGYKEVISKVSGSDVYAKLKYESGAHRVQRVPVTESQGRVHTSACTVAVLPEQDELEAIQINPADLRIDTYRASGAGGQHVNKTDSAVRITHLPTGIVVECQDERSQHKNKAHAMSLLNAKLISQQQEKEKAEITETRRLLVGSGDRSERIRTYNFPQGRLTDHRINLTLYKLDEIIEGELEPVIEQLLQEAQADELAQLGD